jgi:hypothetical protein
MSVCSFLSDEEVGFHDPSSFLEFSLDTSNITKTPIACKSFNLKKLQALLFQTNFYLQKLEERMNETQRKLEVEVCIRQLRSHQTVLGLKINAEVIDDSFMAFVMEKQQKILEEVKKVLDFKNELLSCSDLNFNADTTGMSSPQTTPAFSAQKVFTFKDFDAVDGEVSAKLNQVFFHFFSSVKEFEAIDCIFQGFEKKYPKTAESLQKAVKSIGMYKNLTRRENLSSSESRTREIFKEITGQAEEMTEKAILLQRLHLNLNGGRGEQVEMKTVFVQTENEEYRFKVQVLEEQLQDLHFKFQEISTENEKIKKYQNELVNQVKKNKGENKENCDFFKERYENSNRILLNLQENQKKITKENEFLKKDLKKKVECKK